MLRAALYDVWHAQVKSAVQAMHHHSILGLLMGGPSLAEVPKIMQAPSHSLSGPAIVQRVQHVAQLTISQGFQKEETANDDFAQAKKRLATMNDIMFGAVFGLTEQHALEALTQQPMIAAGSLWDDQLQESIKNEVEGLLSGTIMRDDLSAKPTSTGTIVFLPAMPVRYRKVTLTICQYTSSIHRAILARRSIEIAWRDALHAL